MECGGDPVRDVGWAAPVPGHHAAGDSGQGKGCVSASPMGVSVELLLGGFQYTAAVFDERWTFFLVVDIAELWGHMSRLEP